MPGSFRIGRIAGIDINVHISWLIILVLLTFSLASGYFPTAYPGQIHATYIVLGAIATILLFVSVLLHELAHSFVARSRGLPVHTIVLFIFGGVSNIEQEPRTPGVEFFMAFIGPVVSLVIGAICYGILFLLKGNTTVLVPLLTYLASMNILLGIFNLIPGFPLDGGRVLRSILWKITGNAQKATTIASGVGQFFAYLFIFYGILLFFTGSGVSGLFLAFIGWFLLSAAQSARTQSMLDNAFTGVQVGQIMTTNPETTPANISLQKLVDEYFLPRGLRSAFVVYGDQLAGLITLSDIRHVPREQWGQMPVGLAMVSADRLHTVTSQQSLKDVVKLMNEWNVNQLPVVEDGKLVGVLTRETILRSLEVRSHLGVQQKQDAQGSVSTPSELPN
ncbi:MAG TPA: site-2 protease family protein [Ktedonobacteraceae bacterium]|jgi:Zn-dependent protease|nr:site-2 protease family protein [Ktedonobacteraceae bacterium]